MTNPDWVDKVALHLLKIRNFAKIRKLNKLSICRKSVNKFPHFFADDIINQINFCNKDGYEESCDQNFLN